MKKKNYLNNKDILYEIHKSKNRFSSFTDDQYSDYDIIIHSLSEINDEIIYQAKVNQAKIQSLKICEEKKKKGEKIKLSECEVSPDSISKFDLIFRLMTYEHIPDDPDRKRNPKTIADNKIKLNFPPFQHWKFNESNELICVGKSHWIGGMENGYFSKDHTEATNKLAQMWIKISERYASKGNVRGYSYNDEMKSQAILQLSQIGLQFDESKSQNPFSYYTSVIKNSFIRIINLEKKNQSIRDDLLEMNNMTPSYTRTNDNEWQQDVNRYYSN